MKKKSLILSNFLARFTRLCEVCHKQRYHLQQKLTAKVNRVFFFANSLSLLPDLIFGHIENSRTSNWEDMLLFFFSFDVSLQWELEAFSFPPFIMRLLTASCAPTSIPGCALSAEPVCLCFFLYVCMNACSSVCVFLPSYTQLPCQRILSLNLIRTLTSCAMSWITYLCLWRSLSPLTRFCLVLVARLVTGHARNSMWPWLLASVRAVVRAVTQSERVNSACGERGALCNNIRPLERVLSGSVHWQLPQLLSPAYEDASWQAAGLSARGRLGSTHVNFLSVQQS